MKSLLIIGGSGFFGKSILDAYARGLLQPWHVGRIIVMARHAHELKQLVPQLLSECIELISADIAKIDSLPDADYVIHAAASTDIRDYLSRPVAEQKNIQAGTYNYCRLAKIYHRQSKILYVSSGAVYGQQPASIQKITESFSDISLQDMEPGKLDYAKAKQDAELAIIDLGLDGLDVSIARCFAFVGLWLPRNQHFAIGNFVESVLSKTAIIVKAKHKVYRSYMYADDLVEWLLTITASASTDCPVYNVGSDKAVLMGDLALNMSKQFDVTAQVPEISDPKIDTYIPSIEKAKQQLGLSIKYDLSAAIELTVSRIQNIIRV